MHDLEAANVLVKELKAKIDHLENDKSSLVTAIRIIQENNNAQVNQNSPKNKAKRSQKQSKSKKVDNNGITPTNLHAEEQSEFTEIQPDQTKSDNSNNQRANNRPQNAKESNPTNVVIAGDSMIKHINAHKLSKADTKVRVQASQDVPPLIWMTTSNQF